MCVNFFCQPRPAGLAPQFVGSSRQLHVSAVSGETLFSFLANSSLLASRVACLSGRRTSSRERLSELSPCVSSILPDPRRGIHSNQTRTVSSFEFSLFFSSKSHTLPFFELSFLYLSDSVESSRSLPLLFISSFLPPQFYLSFSPVFSLFFSVVLLFQKSLTSCVCLFC